MEAQHLLELAFISDPQVSPAGEAIAAVVTRASADEAGTPRYRSQVQLFDPELGQQGEVDGGYSDNRPRFSPDGSSLAFLSRAEEDAKPQIRLLDLGNDTTVRLSDEPGGVFAFEWSPDGKRLAYLASSEASEREARHEEGARDESSSNDSATSETGSKDPLPVSRVIDRLRHKWDGKGYLPLQPASLRLVELATREVRTVEVRREGLDFEELAWSGDGEHLLLSSAANQDERDEARRRIWRLLPEDPEPVALTGAMHLNLTGTDPSGHSVTFFAPSRDDNSGGPSAVWSVAQDGGAEPRRLTGVDDDLSPATGGDSRFGDYPNRPLWLSPQRLLVNLNRAGRSHLAELALEATGQERHEGEGARAPGAGELKLLTEGDLVVTAFHAAGGTIAFTRESPERPGELYVLSGNGRPRRLSRLNDALAERLSFRRAEGPFAPVAGHDAAYWRIDPARARDDHALVLQVHGGPHTNSGFGFHFEFQLLAAKGYTVVYGNPRGSSSYGFDFATSVQGGYGSGDADDLLAFVDHALSQHARHDAPVHLTGGSYGGFMTNWLVAQDDRFRSAVTQRSICNFLSFYGTSDIGYWFSERELEGNPWHDFELLWRHSPLRLADRVTTPLLILHAEGDLRCPVEQGQQLFTALKRLGRAETRLVLFPEEGHELSRSGRPDRRIERLEEIIDWFEAHP